MKTVKEIFNEYCVFINKDWKEYIINDKKGFIEALEQNTSQYKAIIAKQEEYITILKNALDCLADNGLIKEDKNDQVNDILSDYANRGAELFKDLAKLKEGENPGKG